MRSNVHGNESYRDVGIDSRHDIVEYDSVAAGNMLVDIPGGERLDDVEDPEEEKRGYDILPRGGQKQGRREVADDFVDDNLVAVVFLQQLFRLAGDPASRTDEQCENQQIEGRRTGPQSVEKKVERYGDDGADSARGDGEVSRAGPGGEKENDGTHGTLAREFVGIVADRSLQETAQCIPHWSHQYKVRKSRHLHLHWRKAQSFGYSRRVGSGTDMQTNSSIGARVGSWVSETGFADLPRRVVEEAKSQILSMIAAVHAGHFSETGRIVSRTVRDWPGGKEATLIPSGERTSLHSAIFGNTALSMALDYDDYLLGGHTGHGSVLVALAMAEKLSIGGKDFLLAQILANEIGGRVGVSAQLGPVRGQMASCVHLAASAVAAAKSMKLPAEQIEHGLSVALGQSGPGIAAAFYGSDAKVVVAAAATPFGVQAMELAANGFRTVSDVFDPEHGVAASLSPCSLAGAFSGLGSVWLTETLCYKIYPCSAHIGAVVDGVLNLARQHHIDVRKVRAIEVGAGPATIETDVAVAPYLSGPESLATTLSSCVAYNVAVALLDKELSPRQFSRDRIKDPAVWELAGRVRLSLDPEMAERVRERTAVKAPATSGESPPFDLGSADLMGFRMGFGARVRIETEDGRAVEVLQDSPYGGGTRSFDDRCKAVEDKFRRETRYSLRKERMERAIDVVYHLEEASASQVRELVRLCCSERG